MSLPSSSKSQIFVKPAKKDPKIIVTKADEESLPRHRALSLTNVDACNYKPGSLHSEVKESTRKRFFLDTNTVFSRIIIRLRCP